MARYDDETRAEAVTVLTAAGYPDRKGALTQTSNQLGIPMETLRRWFYATSNPPPPKIVSKKKAELADRLEEVAHQLLDAMPGKIEGASLQQIATAFGIAVDKRQLLTGDATDRIEVNDHYRERLAQLLSRKAADTGTKSDSSESDE